MRIRDRDPVTRRTVSVIDFEPRPGTGYAGTDPQYGSPQLDSQDALDRGAVDPTCRPRLPGPTAPPDVRGRRIHIGTDDIGLDLVAMNARASTRMINRVEQ